MSDKKIPPMPVFRPHPNAIDLMAYYKEVMAGRVKGNIALTIDSILGSKSPNRGYMYGFDSAGKPMYRDSDTQSPVTEEGIMGEHMMRAAGIEFVAGKPIPEGKHMYEDNDIDLYYPEATIPIALGKQMRGLGMSGGLRRGEYFNHAAFTTRTPYDRPRSNILADALTNLKDRSRIGLISLEQPSFFDRLRSMYYRPQFTVYDTEVSADGIVRHFAKQFNHPGLVVSGQSLAKQVKDTPYLTIRDDGYFVGGKKVLNSVLGTIWLNLKGADKERFVKYHRFEGTWVESPKLLPNQPREPWAEEAIDSMLYQRMYGKLPEIWLPSKHAWGVLNPNGVLCASMVHYEKMRARKRLQDANKLDMGKKRDW